MPVDDGSEQRVSDVIPRDDLIALLTIVAVLDGYQMLDQPTDFRVVLEKIARSITESCNEATTVPGLHEVFQKLNFLIRHALGETW